MSISMRTKDSITSNMNPDEAMVYRQVTNIAEDLFSKKDIFILELFCQLVAKIRNRTITADQMEIFLQLTDKFGFNPQERLRMIALERVTHART